MTGLRGYQAREVASRRLWTMRLSAADPIIHRSTLTRLRQPIHTRFTIARKISPLPCAPDAMTAACRLVPRFRSPNCQRVADYMDTSRLAQMGQSTCQTGVAAPTPLLSYRKIMAQLGQFARFKVIRWQIPLQRMTQP